MADLKSLYRLLDRWGARLAGTRYVQFSRDCVMNERFQFIVAELKRLNKKPLSILDVGCGGGFFLVYLDRSLPATISHYTGIDWRAASLRARFAGNRIYHRFKNVNLDEEWNEGTFDVVVCLEVIEHLMNDDGLMMKLARSLKPGGRLFLTTPSSPFVEAMGEQIPGFSDTSPTQDGGHVRSGYVRAQLEVLARKHGLIPETFGWISRFSPNELRRYLRWNSPLGYIWHNFAFPRSSSLARFAEEDGTPDQAERYWSIGMTCRKE